MTAPHNVLQGVLHRLSSAVEELNSDGALNLPSLKLLLGNSPASEIPAGKIPVIVPAQKRPASNLPVPKLPPTKLPASMLCQIRQRYPNLRHRKKFLPYPLPNLPCLTHRLTSRQQHLPLVPC